MFVCPYASARESRDRARKAKRERERNAHSTARHLSVPVQCLRKCTLILAIKEQIVRGAMPALTAAVQPRRLQGGRRLAQAFSLHSLLLQVPVALRQHPHPSRKKQPLCLSLRTYAPGWKKRLQTDVGDSSKPDECVIRLALYLRVAANVLICEDFGRDV